MRTGNGTVVKAHQAYNRGGWAEVKVTRGHRPKGSGRLLSAAEESEVQRLIQDRTPDQLKMNYALWTIEESFGSRISSFEGAHFWTKRTHFRQNVGT